MLRQKDTRFLLCLSTTVIACLLLATTPTASYLWKTTNPLTDELDRASYRLAGASAVDCGAVNAGDSSGAEYQAADRCAAEAFRTSKAFRVRHDSLHRPDDA